MNRYILTLADDHNLLRHGIRQILEKQENLAVISEAGDGYLLKAIDTVQKGDTYISPLIHKGLTNDLAQSNRAGGKIAGLVK